MWRYIAGYGILAGVFLIVKKKNSSCLSDKKVMPKVFAIMFAVLTISLMMDVAGGQIKDSREVRKIERSGYGKANKTEQLLVEVDGEKPKKIEVEVSSRKYKESEIEKLFQEAKKRMDKMILGENKTALHVDHPLVLPEQLEGFPFRIYWEFSRYDVIDMNGKLNKEEICKEDPDGEGIPCAVKAILNYEGKESLYTKEILVFSPVEHKKGMVDQIRDEVKILDEKQVEQDNLVLPQQIHGRKIKWMRQEHSALFEFVIYGLLISFCLFMVEKEREQKEERTRQEEMLRDYPQIVSQFTLLMEAGMNAKYVWKKIAEDYEQKKLETGKRKEAYEEIWLTYQEMRSGIPEMECYERFARRVQAAPYRKLGILLAQNLKKGSQGIAKILYMESFQMMEEVKSRARMEGEKAGTKLLGPMLMMLFVVLLIVIIPAFLSIQV